MERLGFDLHNSRIGVDEGSTPHNVKFPTNDRKILIFAQPVPDYKRHFLLYPFLFWMNNESIMIHYYLFFAKFAETKGYRYCLEYWDSLKHDYSHQKRRPSIIGNPDLIKQSQCWLGLSVRKILG